MAKIEKKRLDVLLVERGLVQTRARAAARVIAGDVVVGEHRADKPGHKYRSDVAIRLKGDSIPDVSRGGLKLRAALEAFPGDLTDAVGLDVGASTGGFTDVLLKNGAQRVFAVDVGYGQLHWDLRNDPRVTNMERTHIGKVPVGSLVPAPDVMVIDVSFISLDRVLPAATPHLVPGARAWVLIKPQFEVGKDAVGKGGIVRDDAAREEARDRVLSGARALGWRVAGCIDCPVHGADGNVEFLAHLVLDGTPAADDADGVGAKHGATDETRPASHALEGAGSARPTEHAGDTGEAP